MFLYPVQKHVDSVEGCQETCNMLCHDSPLPTEDEHETSEGTCDWHSGYSASSDDEPQQVDCIIEVSDDRLEYKLRSKGEPDGNEVEVSSFQGNIQLGSAILND